MTDLNNLSIFIGILLLSGIVFGIFSSVPAIEKPNYLEIIPLKSKQVLISVFFQFLMAVTYTLITISFFPILFKFNNILAIGYFGFRIIGSVFLFTGIVSLLLLLSVCQKYTKLSLKDSIFIGQLAEFIRLSRDWLNHLAMILPWTIGGFILYFSLFKMQIIPSYIAILGMIASILTLVATFLFMFRKIKIVSVPYFILNIPTALLEVYFAFYLFKEGFLAMG